MAQSSSTPRSLVLHDGELDDICALIATLGMGYTEQRGRPEAELAEIAWDLVIATPRRLLELAFAPDARPTRIAVLEKDSKTLRSMLQRAAIELIVLRPVHPEALRLLIVHSLYRGPENRGSRRVSIGAPVRIRTGLRRRPAILADLSVSGCRVLCDEPIADGKRVSISIPAEVARGKRFTLSGRVVRSDRGAAGMVVAIEFPALSAKAAERLKRTLSTHTDGPAVYEGAVSEAPAEITEAANVAPAAVTGGAASGPAAAASADGGCTAQRDERRSSPRRDFPKQVVALGLEAARVLIGRDISLGGMRIEAHSEVSLGDDLQIALHLRAREEPLIVQARVERDDGNDGLLLKFHDLPEATESYLQRMVSFLPIIAVREEGEEGAGIIVSEILEITTD